MNALQKLKDERDELEGRINALVTEAAPIRDQLSNLDRQRDRLRNRLSQIRSEIAQLCEKPRISDHAVIRYLERKYGFNFEHIRDEMLTPTVRSAMEAGAEGVKINGGTLKIKGRTVTTFIEA